LPPEYCEWAPRGVNFEECKRWLQEAHPGLYDEIYPPVEENEGAEGEETKEASSKSRKPKGPKKVAFASDMEKKVRVIKQKRGGKKVVSSITGLDAFGCDLAEIAKIFSKKLGTGAAAMQIEYKELNLMGI
jgi:density-regulated protein